MSDDHPDAPARGREGRRRPAQVIILVGLILAEALLLAGLTAFLLFELLTERPDSYLSALALTVLSALAAVWLIVIARGILRGQSWVRGATVTWQVLQIAIAIGSFQSEFARPDIGWALLAPAVAVLVLLFSRPVMLLTARRDDRL